MKAARNYISSALYVAGTLLILSLLWKFDLTAGGIGVLIFAMAKIIELLADVLVQMKQAAEVELIRNLPKAKPFDE